MPKKLDIPIPDYFRCPISLELMREPVTLSTGQTYDRASIEKWVMDGNATCPATMQRLHDFTLIPNHTLRRLIQEWCFANQSPFTEPSALKKLFQEAQNGTKDAKIEALRSLRSLAKDSDKNRSMILQQGAIPILADALFQDLESIKDMEVAGEALGVLSMLRLTEKEADSIAKSDRLVFLGSILGKGQTESRINGALLIERMIMASDLLKEKIGEASGMIEGILKLVKEGGKSRVSKIGIRVLFSLCLSNSGSNIDRSVKAGAASILVEHLPDSTKGDADRTLATLELICKTEAGKSAVSSHALSVPVLIKMILQVSDQATECAAGTLCSICSCSKSVQQYAVQTGIFTQLLLLIQSDCTDRAKRKAMELLRMLGNSWSQDPCLAEFGRTSIVAF